MKTFVEQIYFIFNFNFTVCSVCSKRDVFAPKVVLKFRRNSFFCHCFVRKVVKTWRDFELNWRQRQRSVLPELWTRTESGKCQKMFCFCLKSEKECVRTVNISEPKPGSVTVCSLIF